VRIIGLEPELITPVMEDICRRAMHCGVVEVAPTFPLSTLLVLLWTQFMIDNSVSAALVQKLAALAFGTSHWSSKPRASTCRPRLPR